MSPYNLFDLSAHRLTFFVILGILVLLLIWDVWLAANGTPGDTISAVVHRYGTQSWFFLIGTGVLLGHLLWPLQDGRLTVEEWRAWDAAQNEAGSGSPEGEANPTSPESNCGAHSGYRESRWALAAIGLKPAIYAGMTGASRRQAFQDALGQWLADKGVERVNSSFGRLNGAPIWWVTVNHPNGGIERYNVGFEKGADAYSQETLNELLQRLSRVMQLPPA